MFEGKILLEEVLNEEYLSKNLGFNSLEELKNNIPVSLDVEDVAGIDSEELNSFIRERSKFDSWRSLLTDAFREMAIKKFRDGGLNAR